MAAAAVEHPASVGVAAAAAMAVEIGAGALPSLKSLAASAGEESPSDAPRGVSHAPPDAAAQRSKAWRDVCAMREDAFATAGARILSRHEFLRKMAALATGLGVRRAIPAGARGGEGEWECGLDVERVWLAEALRLRRHRRFRSLVQDQRLREGRLLAGWSLSNLSGGRAALFEDDEAALFLGASALLPAASPFLSAAASNNYAAARGASLGSPGLHIRTPDRVAAAGSGAAAAASGGLGEEDLAEEAGAGSMSPGSQALAEGAGASTRAVGAAPKTPPSAAVPAPRPCSAGAGSPSGRGASDSDALDEELEVSWTALHDAVAARRRGELDAPGPHARGRAASGPRGRGRGESLGASDAEAVEVPTPRVVRALLDYLQGEVRIAYSVRQRWAEDAAALLQERQRLRAVAVPAVLTAQALAASRGGRRFAPDSSGRVETAAADAMLLAEALLARAGAGLPGPAPPSPAGAPARSAAAAAAAAAAAGAGSSSDAASRVPPAGLEWVPATLQDYRAAIKRLSRSVVYARLARAATGSIRTLSGERAAVGSAARTQLLEKLWCASLRCAPRIPLSRIEVRPAFLAPLDWAPWLPPFWLCGRLLAAMDAEVSGAGLGDPFRVRELLLTAVEVAVWEAGERARSARRLAGKAESQVDVGAEDLLPLLVLAVSRCAGGYDFTETDAAVATEADAAAATETDATETDAAAATETDATTATGSTHPRPKPAIPQAPLAPARMRCPWRLPLQTLNYLANFAIGRDAAAGRLSYLVISMHGAVTFVMQRAKEEGAGAAMETLARARRIHTARARRAMTSAGPTPQTLATTPLPASSLARSESGTRRTAGGRDFSDSDSDGGSASESGSERPGLPAADAGKSRSSAPTGSVGATRSETGAGWTLVDAVEASVAAAAAGPLDTAGAGDGAYEGAEEELGDEAMDALEVAEAAVAAQALAPSSPGRPQTAGGAEAEGAGVAAGHTGGTLASDAGGAAVAEGGLPGLTAIQRVGVEMAIKKLASLQHRTKPDEGSLATVWMPGADSAGLHTTHADAYADEDECEAEDLAEVERAAHISEDEVTMIAMPGDADRPDKEGMTDLKRWLGQQELLEDTVEILT